jgi:hypothetical protein
MRRWNTCRFDACQFFWGQEPRTARPWRIEPSSLPALSGLRRSLARFRSGGVEYRRQPWRRRNPPPSGRASAVVGPACEILLLNCHVREISRGQQSLPACSPLNCPLESLAAARHRPFTAPGRDLSSGRGPLGYITPTARTSPATAAMRRGRSLPTSQSCRRVLLRSPRASIDPTSAMTSSPDISPSCAH